MDAFKKMRRSMGYNASRKDRRMRDERRRDYRQNQRCEDCEYFECGVCGFAGPCKNRCGKSFYDGNWKI